MVRFSSKSQVRHRISPFSSLLLVESEGFSNPRTFQSLAGFYGFYRTFFFFLKYSINIFLIIILSFYSKFLRQIIIFSEHIGTLFFFFQPYLFQFKSRNSNFDQNNNSQCFSLVAKVRFVIGYLRFPVCCQQGPKDSRLPGRFEVEPPGARMPRIPVPIPPPHPLPTLVFPFIRTLPSFDETFQLTTSNG